jgi:hypothetical protein
MYFDQPTSEFLKRIGQCLGDYSELVGENQINEKSAPDYQNVYFCYEKENVVIMDNHRCALWFWIKNTDKKLKYNIQCPVFALQIL